MKTTETIALIVGGSTGIGKAVARKLLEGGTAVVTGAVWDVDGGVMAGRN